MLWLRFYCIVETVETCTQTSTVVIPDNNACLDTSTETIALPFAGICAYQPTPMPETLAIMRP